MESSETKTRLSSTKKKVAVVAAIILAATLAIGGTYAWQSFNTRVLNDAFGEPGPAGGRLHDDFEYVGPGATKTEWTAGLSANKDIYVENYESAAGSGRDIFARVKLYEYIEIGDGAALTSTDAGYATREASSIVQGANRDDPTTWSVANPNAESTSDPFRARFTWDMGGQKTYMPTFNKDNMSDEADIKGSAEDLTDLDAGELENSTEVDGIYEYALEAAEPNYFVTNTTHEATEKTYDLNSATHIMGTSVVEHTSTQTINGTVITMAEWKTAPYNSQPGDYWVIDTDGWAYWANPLSVGTATGLLLDSITLTGEDDEEWYYAIFVKSEMATAGDWSLDSDNHGFYSDPTQTPSADAENLLNIITGNLPKVVSVTIDGDNYAAQANIPLTIAAAVETEYTTDPAFEALTWTVTPNVGTRFNNGVFTPSAADAGKWFTVSAASVKDPSIKDSCMVYVVAAGQSSVMGADGAIYLTSLPDDNTYQKVNADGSLATAVCPVTIGQPGIATDRPVITLHGQKLLPAGSDLYDAVGADGLLGTSDDPLVYDNGTAIVPSQNQVSLTVTASPATTVMQGFSIDLTASALFNETDAGTSNITWMIVGSSTSSLSVASGSTTTFTAGINQTPGNVVVRITKPAEPTGIYPTATKDINITVISSGPIPAHTTSYTDNGVLWRVLKDNRPASGASVVNDFGISTVSDGSGTILVITDRVYSSGGTASFQPGWYGSGDLNYNTINAYSTYADSDGSLKTFSNNFYQNTVSSSLKASARIPNLNYESGYQPDATTAALSTPGAAAGSTTTGILFPLSNSEVNSYMGTTYANRIGMSITDIACIWWLRSPDRRPEYVAYVSAAEEDIPGNIPNASVVVGGRPAMWLDATP